MKNKLFPIPGFEKRYAINTDGDIYRISRTYIDLKNRNCSIKKKKLKGFIDRGGYPCFILVNNDEQRNHRYLHRLLAITFIRKPVNKDVVNHINGNKQDYRLENLEWVTFKENWFHAVANNLIKLGKENKIPLKNICTGKIYSSIGEAAQDLKIRYNTLQKLISSKRINKTCIRKIKRSKYDFDVNDIY